MRTMAAALCLSACTSSIGGPVVPDGGTAEPRDGGPVWFDGGEVEEATCEPPAGGTAEATTCSMPYPVQAPQS